jgi:rhodanese-related sulfurtransferase
MLGKLAMLPINLAKRVARRIQAADAEYYAGQTPAADTNAASVKRTIPAHELADLPAETVQKSPADLLDQAPFWLDVRGPSEWGDERIAGAEHMRQIDLMIRLAELPPNELLVAYCNDGADALVAALFLRRRGFEHAYALTGGIEAWKQAGGPVES